MSTDAELKARVAADLKQNWRFDPTGITIDAHRGAVTLGGEVCSHAERKIAEADARDVVGVAWVSNQISTRVDSRDDRLIRDDVEYRLDTDYATADLGIDVTVDHGVVTLKGETVSWFERDRAADLAAAVGGVREVDNRLTVDGYDYPWIEYSSKYPSPYGLHDTE